MTGKHTVEHLFERTVFGVDTDLDTFEQIRGIDEIQACLSHDAGEHRRRIGLYRPDRHIRRSDILTADYRHGKDYDS